MLRDRLVLAGPADAERVRQEQVQRGAEKARAAPVAAAGALAARGRAVGGEDEEIADEQRVRGARQAVEAPADVRAGVGGGLPAGERLDRDRIHGPADVGDVRPAVIVVENAQSAAAAAAREQQQGAGERRMPKEAAHDAPPKPWPHAPLYHRCGVQGGGIYNL